MPFAIRGGGFTQGFTQENLCIQRPRQIAEGILEFLDLWCSETSEPLVDVMKKKIHLSSVQNRCWDYRGLYDPIYWGF